MHILFTYLALKIADINYNLHLFSYLIFSLFFLANVSLKRKTNKLPSNLDYLHF